MTVTASSEPLLLDEMLSPRLAEALVAAGHNVVAVAGHATLAAAADVQVAAWAAQQGRRVVTENVRDIVPLLATVEPPLRVLLTSSRRYPRSRQNPAPLVRALSAWLTSDEPRASMEWLP